MQTRRDQLQAYRYQVRRVLTALLGSDPDSPEQPMRRVTTATLSGVMVAVLALVGAGFYGKVRGGSPSKWQQAGVLIVERETGSRYIYTDQQLHPILNYTSARLLLNTATVPTVQVARKSLEGAARGATVGIAGAPDSLPDAKHLIAGPWSVCAQPGPTVAGAGSAAESVRHPDNRRPRRRLTARRSRDARPVGVQRLPRLARQTAAHGLRVVAKRRPGFPTGVERSRQLAQRRPGRRRPASTVDRVVGRHRPDSGGRTDERR